MEVRRWRAGSESDRHFQSVSHGSIANDEARCSRRNPCRFPDESKIPVLLVENDATTLLLYSKYLKHTVFQLFPVRTVAEARRVLSTIRPKAVILDILLDGDNAWSFLTRLKNDPATKNIPAIIVTTIEDQQKGLALGADRLLCQAGGPAVALTQLTDRTRPVDQGQVLIIDDEESSRYIVKTFLKETPYSVVGSGERRGRLAPGESACAVRDSARSGHHGCKR